MARFTAANARENAAKAHAARRQRLVSGTQAEETFPQTPQVNQQEAADDYIMKRLARVRVQLDSVDRAIEAEATKATPDGQRLNWLAQAQERLAEQERILDNRPLPGSRRPKSDARPRRGRPPIQFVRPARSPLNGPTPLTNDPLSAVEIPAETKSLERECETVEVRPEDREQRHSLPERTPTETKAVQAAELARPLNVATPVSNPPERLPVSPSVTAPMYFTPFAPRNR